MAEVSEKILELLEQLSEVEVPSDLTSETRSAWINGWGACWLKVMDVVKGRPDTTRIR